MLAIRNWPPRCEMTATAQDAHRHHYPTGRRTRVRDDPVWPARRSLMPAGKIGRGRWARIARRTARNLSAMGEKNATPSAWSKLPPAFRRHRRPRRGEQGRGFAGERRCKNEGRGHRSRRPPEKSRDDQFGGAHVVARTDRMTRRNSCAAGWRWVDLTQVASVIATNTEH